MNKSCVAACLKSVRMAVESVSGCSWSECPDQRGITIRMCVEWVSESAWNPQARLRVEHVFDDLDQLMVERERNSIFDHETGYICSVEQGQDRGYHIHAAFFFNGNEVRGDIHKAQLIGELWERITRGYGCFNSCNHDKDRYEGRLGIGMIRRDDLRARQHVHEAMRYLVKDEQPLLVKPLRAKCLRKGQVC